MVAPGPPELVNDGTGPSDLDNICPIAEVTFPESGSNSVTMAVDAAALKASQTSPASARSTSALHGLMEQGVCFHYL